jgi:hypothetical protein
MGLIDNWMYALDETLSDVLGQWDKYSTSIVALFLGFFLYQAATRRDPDAHPMILARQAQASPIRNPGESPIFRSHSSPHGMELNSGLNVRDPGLSKWARGRNGDIRDVWRRISSGAIDKEGNLTGVKGRILTVLGSEQVIEHDLGEFTVKTPLTLRLTTFVDEISKQINIVGQHIKQNKGARVAIYLPNSIELLTTLFACAFYDLTPILMPFNQPATTVISMLKASKADSIVAAVGSLPFDAITKAYPAIRELIWVVDEGSRHMDWNEVPKGTGGAVNVCTWQEVIEDQKDTTAELPAIDASVKAKNLLAFWQSNPGDAGQVVEYTQANLVSAISGQLTAIPASQRISPSDMIFPADSLSTIYTLTVTLAALYYNASLALNSVAGPNTDLVLATQAIAPTIIVASSSTLAKTHKETSSKIDSSFHKLIHWLQTRTLTKEGTMPLSSILTRFNDSLRPSVGIEPGKLRILFVGEQAGSNSIPLTSLELSDLRIFTGSRVIYALTAPNVAGAVAQTAFYDYRVDDTASVKHSHFGAPLSCVEYLLRDTKDHKTTDDLSIGKVREEYA